MKTGWTSIMCILLFLTISLSGCGEASGDAGKEESGMDWEDKAILGNERVMGEWMANYGLALSMMDRGEQVSRVVALITSLKGNETALSAIGKFSYQYFYYPGAPQYDPELYLLFVNALLPHYGFDEGERERLECRRRDIRKNRIGTKASDFRFVDAEGMERGLYEVSEHADIKILMLYDPDCNVCDEAIKILTGSAPFSEALRDGEVAVIAINAYGQESGGKAKVKEGMPSEWIVGYSPEGEIDEKEIYVIRATPSIYILDKEGVVIEKDITLGRLAEIVV